MNRQKLPSKMQILALFMALVASQGQCFKKNRPEKRPAPIEQTPNQPSPNQPTPPENRNIQWSGNRATLTWFNDGQVQCFKFENMPSGPRFAVNPILLGFTAQDFFSRYSKFLGAERRFELQFEVKQYKEPLLILAILAIVITRM